MYDPTNFPDQWPLTLRHVFERLRKTGDRVRIISRHGDVQEGRVSRTLTGNNPIILHNKRSRYGYTIDLPLTIIETKKPRRVLWDMARDEPIMYVMIS